jgi:hypothetical protein
MKPDGTMDVEQMRWQAEMALQHKELYWNAFTSIFASVCMILAAVGAAAIVGQALVASKSFPTY